MNVYLIHPPDTFPPSGGHVYNHRLLTEARHRAYPLSAWPLAPNQPAPCLEHGAIGLWDSLFIARLAAAPPAATGAIHGLLVHYLPHADPLLAVPERRQWRQRFADAVAPMRFLLTTGHGVAARLRQDYPGKPVYLCEPGVDPLFVTARRTLAGHGTALRLATVANLLPAKGQMECLEILAKLDTQDWEWHLVGADWLDPDYRRAFDERSESLKLAGKIVRHGVLETPALAELLARMDLGVFPSHYEAYGMALAEAAAAALPLLATAVGEAERIVRHGETGFLVAPGDGQGLRESLTRLLTDVGLRRRFRERLLQDRPRSWEDTFGDFTQAMDPLLL